MVDLEKYGMEALERYAAHLNSISASDLHATISYDVWAGALVWSDETNELTPSDVFHALRQLRHYRTHVMLNDITPNNEVWQHCQSLFPNWIGFLPERHQQTMELLKVYRRGYVSSRWCLRQLERQSETCDNEPSDPPKSPFGRESES
jgi:hypothetical protein